MRSPKWAAFPKTGKYGLRDARRAGGIPVLVVSARHQEAEKVKLLDAGADDYLAKPFSVGELLARIRVAMRHRGTALAPAKDRRATVG